MSFGIPPAVAVASQANQVIANSVSSLQVQWRRGNVDLRMGLVLLLGGMIGSSAGVTLFSADAFSITTGSPLIVTVPLPVVTCPLFVGGITNDPPIGM